MNNSELNNKVKVATKWSAVTEVLARLVTPISSMVLARLLTPDAFGIVTTIAMITTFAEIFTDAGFQKYLIQHEFKNNQDKEECTNVAFWSNLTMSLFIWGIISIFNNPLSRLVGNPGMGHTIIVACASIPLAAFSSIQMALYKRDLDFKTLFKVRIVAILIPLLITIPLAFLMHSYWALIIGTLAVNLANALLLTAYSKWKPRFFYSFGKLKEMLSFTIWSMLESISIWLTGYVDVFIVGTTLSQYYLGLYKTSSTLVGQIMGLITATTTPILFSSLSRLQSNENEFRSMFFKFQKLVGLLVIPLGVGIFLYSDLVTGIILGKKWLEASYFVGWWGLTSSLTIVLAHYSSEVYRSKGKPKLSVLAQVLHIIVLWPVVLLFVNKGFNTLCLARSLVRLELILVNMIIMYCVVKISPLDMLRNIWSSVFASVFMAFVSYMLTFFGSSILWQLCSVGICIIVYVGVIMFFPQERNMLVRFIVKKPL